MKRTLRLTAALLLVIYAASLVAADGDPDPPDVVRKRINAAIAKVAENKTPRVLVIPLREGIDLRTAVYVERTMKTVPKDKIDLVLVDMHTPGGRGDAMSRICSVFMKSLDDKGVPVVVFVNTDAYSAGAFICFSCDRIYMAKGGKIGAATGWIPGPDNLPVKLPAYVVEKKRSGSTAGIRTIAKAKGYPSGLAEAMVDRAIVVKEYEIDGKREILSDKDFDERLIDLGIDDPWSEEAKKRIKEIRTISREGELVTLDYDEVQKIGLARAPFGTLDEVLADMGVKNAVKIVAEHNWAEDFFGFFSQTVVKGLLMMVGIWALYMEFKIPGFGVPGIIGVVCLALFFFSQHFMGMSDYVGLVIFGIGVVLLAMEIFVIPGFGIAGVAGIGGIILGLFLSMQPFGLPEIDVPWQMELFKTNLLVLGLALIGSAALMTVAAKFLPKTPFLNRLILTSQGPEGELYASATVEGKGTVGAGAVGKVISSLRPAGRAEFDGEYVDVVAEGKFIDPGAEVKVIKVKGNRIVVRKVG